MAKLIRIIKGKVGNLANLKHRVRFKIYESEKIQILF